MKNNTNHLPRFVIYSADGQPVNFTMGTTRSIGFEKTVLEYRFNGVDGDIALAVFQLVRTAYAQSGEFFGETAKAVNAFCKACGVENPHGIQCHK